MQRTSRPKRKKLAVLAVGASACIAVGIAWAAWTVGGSGSGYAKAGSAALTLGDATASTTADLYPGATGSVKVSITNPNAFPVRVTSVTGNGAITSDTRARPAMHRPVSRSRISPA